MAGFKRKHLRKPHITTTESPHPVSPRARRPMQTWADLMDHIGTHREEIWERIYERKRRLDQGIF